MGATEDIVSVEDGGEDFLVDFDEPKDPENPVNWQPRKKWLIVLVLAAMTFVS